MPGPFPEWTHTSKTKALWPTSTTNSSCACIRFCCPAWSTATAPGSTSATTSPNKPCSPRWCARSTTRTSSRSASAATADSSPWSKWSARPTRSTGAGRTAYLDKRREGTQRAANLVEIDLVLQGQPTLEYSRDGLPDWDYAVTVTRSTQPERYEIYTATLQKRLPRFRLPLAADDRDTVLDLHTAFTRCYDQGGFAAKIDYQATGHAAQRRRSPMAQRRAAKQQKLRCVGERHGRGPRLDTYRRVRAGRRQDC